MNEFGYYLRDLRPSFDFVLSFFLYEPELPSDVKEILIQQSQHLLSQYREIALEKMIDTERGEPSKCSREEVFS